MMRTRTRGEREACLSCNKQTSFQYDVRGPRGAHVKWTPMCPTCGEDVRRRDAALAKAA